MLTNQKAIRKLFWEYNPQCSKKKVTCGSKKVYPCDTRMTFCDFIERLRRDGHISEKMCYKITL